MSFYFYFALNNVENGVVELYRIFLRKLYLLLYGLSNEYRSQSIMVFDVCYRMMTIGKCLQRSR